MAYNSPFAPEEIGEIVFQQPANPAAGADFAATVPAGEVWLLHSVGCTFTTAVAVAARMLGVFIAASAGGRIILYTDQAFTQAASLVETYCFVNQGDRQVLGTNNRVLSTLGLVYLQPGATLTIHVTTIQAADQISAVVYTYQRWLARP